MKNKILFGFGLLVFIGGLFWSSQHAISALNIPDAQNTHSEADQLANTDPFAYCAAVGTVDAPDARYTGPEMPEQIVEALREKLQIPNDAPLTSGTSWRCADGKVKACFVGANLPCYKADNSQIPAPEMNDFCREMPNADLIPAAIVGHGMIYEWGCTNGTPEIITQVFETDAQGFISNFWYEINPITK